jgi:hypothetical protein
MGKGKTHFTPGLETDEQFNALLDVLARWIKSGAVAVDIDSDGDVEFTLPDELNELMTTQVPEGLTYEQVRGIVKTEIATLLDASLAKNPARYLERSVPDKVLDKNPNLVRRIDRASETLLTPVLADRALLRKATTGFALDEVSWKRVTYHIDGPTAERHDVPCVSMQLSFVKPGAAPILSVKGSGKSFSITPGERLSVVLELHKDDLVQLIGRLQEIQGSLDTQG